MVGRQSVRGYFGHHAIDFDRGWKIAGNEQIATIASNHQPQQVVDEFTGLFAFHVGSLDMR
jgi:hypothetical protein